MTGARARRGAKVGAARPMTTAAHRLRSILGGSAGNLVEWFDWFTYASFAIYFSKAFFPSDDPTAQLLKSALVFAGGFLARPLGALLLGLYADRAGRRAALAASVIMMCAGSMLIALVPTSGGAWSTAALVAARLLQGLSVGGEYGASATYVAEMAGRRRRGFWSGFLYVTLIGGQLLAMSLQVVLQAVLGEAELAAWGWRIPFFVGGLLAVGVSWLRRTLHETPAFARSATQERGRVGLLFGRYLRETATVVALTAGGGVGFYTYTTYMQKLLVNSAGLPAPVVSQLMVAVLASFLVLPPLAGALADRIGHKRTLVGSFVGGALVAVPTLTALSTVRDPWVAYALCLVPLVFLSGYTALSAILKAELYPAEVRALGVAVPYALAMALFGGNAESAALALKEAGHETAYFWLVAALMAVGSIAAASMPDLDRHGKVEAHDDEPT